MKFLVKKRTVVILLVTVILALAMFLFENVYTEDEMTITRNTYGEGKKTEEYELSIEGEKKQESMEILIEEQEYTYEEMQSMFRKVMEELDEVVLGENESFNHVEKNLQLVTELEGYPVAIEWQLDSYSVMDLSGNIREENLVAEGTLVELRGTISYKEEEAVYVQYAKVYPLTRVGLDKLLYDIKHSVTELEENTRQEASFVLPERVNGKELSWSKKKTNSWCYILIIGIVSSVYQIYRDREKIVRQRKQRKEELMRDYPGMVSKFTMLLGTGATVKHAWERIVKNYEQQKEALGTRIVYEEMVVTLGEMQSGISEVEAYERFGKRCGLNVYMKFGMLLAQNLRKGSKGISDLLRVEAVQSFEKRKSTAKRLGEEAGTKLLMPMMGMLAVVFVMVMVPAFLTMQL